MSQVQHPQVTRRHLIQAGSIGLLGLGGNHLEQLRAEVSAVDGTGSSPPARSVIFIFLSGGLAQHESFDPKPDGPSEVRGEFGAIATRTPGLQI